jgi:hypothetical protein
LNPKGNLLPEYFAECLALELVMLVQSHLSWQKKVLSVQLGLQIRIGKKEQ